MHVVTAWKDWWNGIGHVARCNRDAGRTREAFEAGYLAALEQIPPVGRPASSISHEIVREADHSDGLGRQ